MIWFSVEGSIMDRRKEELMQKAYESGFFFEKTYRGCGQCALAAIFDLTGWNEPLLFQAATGFSGVWHSAAMVPAEGMQQVSLPLAVQWEAA